MKSLSGFFSASVLLLYSVFCGVAVSEPSFNCNLARTSVEKMICADDELSAYDRIFSQKYREFLQKSKDVENLKISQFQWLKSVRNRCDSNECLRQAYHQRYLDLRYGDSVPEVKAQTLGRLLYQEKKAEEEAYLLGLDNDGDWLTGVWVQNPDAYALFEKEGDQYSVKYNVLRQQVSWWTAKAVLEGNILRTWIYRSNGGQLLLPTEPSLVEEYRDGKLYTVKVSDEALDVFYVGHIRSPGRAQDAVAIGGVESFDTGERYVRNEQQRILHIINTVPHLEEIKSSKFLDFFRRGDFRVIAQKVEDGNQYFIAQFSRATNSIPSMGYCGAGVDVGFYWFHLSFKNDDAQLIDEWIHTVDTCRDSKFSHVYHKDHQEYLLTTLDETLEKFEDNQDCFYVKRSELQNKPRLVPCVYSEDLELMPQL